MDNIVYDKLGISSFSEYKKPLSFAEKNDLMI